MIKNKLYSQSEILNDFYLREMSNVNIINITEKFVLISYENKEKVRLELEIPFNISDIKIIDVDNNYIDPFADASDEEKERFINICNQLTFSISDFVSGIPLDSETQSTEYFRFDDPKYKKVGYIRELENGEAEITQITIKDLFSIKDRLPPIGIREFEGFLDNANDIKKYGDTKNV